MPLAIRWPEFEPDENPLSYRCGWCDDRVSSEVGASAYEVATGHAVGLLRMCPGCGHPTYISDDGQTPGTPYGEAVSHLPEQLVELYTEARACLAVGAHHAAVMVGRKILMHVAVEKGADKGKRFVEYVDFLRDNSLVPPDSRGWVDEIREVGNEANHEIPSVSKEEAEGVVDFVAMLLKLVYEFPERGRRSVAARQAKS